MKKIIVAVVWTLMLLSTSAYAGCNQMLDYSDDKVYCVADTVEYGESIAEDQEQQQKEASPSKNRAHQYADQGEANAYR